MTYQEIILTLAQRKYFALLGEPIEYSWTELRDIISEKHSEDINTLGVKLTRSLKQLKDKNLIIHPYRGAKYKLSPEGQEEYKEIVRRQVKNDIEYFMMMTVSPLFTRELVKDGTFISYDEYHKRYQDIINQHYESEIKASYESLKKDFTAQAGEKTS